jgi:hypothetical protein
MTNENEIYKNYSYKTTVCDQVGLTFPPKGGEVGLSRSERTGEGDKYSTVI